MNYFKYKLFAIIFNFFRIFNVNKNRVSFIMPHSANFQGNIKHVYDELNSRGNFKFNFISYSDKQSTLIQKIISFIKTFTINIFYLASSKFIFLNDNFLPMAFMNINPKTLVVQLWHGAGAFKKFGLSSQNNSDLIYLEEKISHKLDLIPVSSKNIAKFYQEAFGVSQDKVLPLGVPRTDFYFNESLAVENIKNKFLEKYPEAKSKKIVLYAPTFRENPGEDENILDNFDFKEFNKKLGDTHFLGVKLHPKINKYTELESNEFFTNFTDYENEKELLLIADILIADYSSIVVEFAILKKPIIFYSYDYDKYNNNERGFYFDYKSMVPGVVVEDKNNLIDAIENSFVDEIKFSNFLNFEFDTLDGKSSKRVVDFCLNYKK